MSKAREHLHTETPHSNTYDSIYSYNPVVKNWFCKKTYEEDASPFSTNKLLNSHYNADKWIYLDTSANMRFSIKTEIMNDDKPTLLFSLTAFFEPGGYKENHTSLPQFVEPYQDKLDVFIAPEVDSGLSLRQSFHGSLSGSANENTKRKVTKGGSEKKVSLGIDHPVHIKIEAKSDKKKTENNQYDFDLQSRAADAKTYYTASQSACYYEGISRYYDYMRPDYYMHNYGHFPDYFCTPSSLARGGLAIQTTQSYALPDLKEERSFNINVTLKQRLVSMSMWRWCANYGFMHDAESYISTTITKGVVTQVGLFSQEIRTRHTRNHVAWGDETILEERNFLAKYTHRL